MNLFLSGRISLYTQPATSSISLKFLCAVIFGKVNFVIVFVIKVMILVNKCEKNSNVKRIALILSLAHLFFYLLLRISKLANEKGVMK